jgi:hypothetical protein
VSVNKHEAEFDVLDAVLFSAGKWRAGFEARAVRASRPAPTGAAGTDVETLLELELSAGLGPRQYLQLKHGDREILVGSPVDLVSLPVAAIHPLPPLLAARCKLNGLRALALEPNAENIILLFAAEAP